MRIFTKTWVGALAVLALLAIGSAKSHGQSPDSLAGRWILVAQRFGNDELLVFELAQDKDAKTWTAKVLDSQRPLTAPSLLNIQVNEKAKTVGFEVKAGGGDSQFHGTWAGDGVIKGGFRFANSLMPAQLIKTDRLKALPLEHKIMLKIRAANRDPDLASRDKALLEILKENPGHPATVDVYASMFRVAEKSKMSIDEATRRIEMLETVSKPYGNLWLRRAQTEAIMALRGQKTYATLSLGLGRKLVDSLSPNAPARQQAEALMVLIDSANLAGKGADVQAEQARLETVQKQLDEDYLKNVIPFPLPTDPTKTKRPEGSKDRVAVFEVFTGTNCPTCVAVDVAALALSKTRPASDVIVLQHHIHIPSPDPLTNPDTIARSKYYNVQATPTIFLNGKPQAGDSGSFSYAQSKYQELDDEAVKVFKEVKKADIQLQVNASGDDINIKVTAKNTTPKPNAALASASTGVKPETPTTTETPAIRIPPDAPPEVVAALMEASARRASSSSPTVVSPTSTTTVKPPDLKLRLLLVEDQVRFVGTNQLRFHYQVVRKTLGDVNGHSFKDDKCELAITVKRSEIQKSLQAFLEKESRVKSFRRGLAPTDLKNLKIVALVQNEADKDVWHAVSVPVNP